MPFLTFPLALLGLIALPTAAAIYLLRSRYRNRTVSSLMLWTLSSQAREGGATVRKPRFPWLLLLELMILAFLVLAAVDPRWLTSPFAEPLFVVLDNSASMQAADRSGKSRKETAESLLKKEVRKGGFSTIRLLVAGQRVRLAGPAAKNWEQLKSQLDQWTTDAPSADLSEGIAMAAELGQQRGRTLVITDEGTSDLQSNNVRWISVGKALPNQAIIQASRKHGTLTDRCLIEVASYAREPVTTQLTLEDSEGQKRSHQLTLAPGTIHRIIFDEPPSTGALKATLGPDALAADNEAWLLAPPPGKVSVKVEMKNAPYRALVEQALRATGRARYTYAEPDILFVDAAPTRRIGGSTWTVTMNAPSEARAYAGPFLTLSTHPLMRGIDLNGTVWAASTNAPSGLPVVSAGPVPLLEDRERGSGAHDVTLHFNPDYSTLQQTPNWPILVWNLLEWRNTQAPGLKDVALRLGTSTEVRVHPNVEQVEVEGPGGLERHTPVQGRVHLQPDQPGLYRIKANNRSYTLAVNFLQPDESNLTSDIPGEWGQWGDRQESSRRYAATTWIWVLLVLCGLLLHAIFLRRGAGE